MRTYVVHDSIRNRNREELTDRFALDILTGLSSTPKTVPSTYFYDSEGSRLFSLLTETEDYYPTRCEFEILHGHGAAIARELGPTPFRIIELGAGDGRKTSVLLRQLTEAGHRFDYVPIDISEAAIQDLFAALGPRHPTVPFRGVVGDYLPALESVVGRQGGTPGSPAGEMRNFVLFLGSNIGNFSRNETLFFLRKLWKTLNPGDLLLTGFDLKKDIHTLLRAYNDGAGITRRFNLNLLERINRELGADFRTDRFEHFGTYNPRIGAMESYLVSLEPQSVYVGALDKRFEFNAFEAIHVEYSYKYLPSETQALADETGYEVVGAYRDERGFFQDSLWRVVKEATQSRAA